MIRDRGSNFAAAFDAVLAGAGIRTVLCNVRTPRMTRQPNAGSADAAASFWTVPSPGIRTICGRSALVLNPHQPAGNLEDLLSNDPWAATGIL